MKHFRRAEIARIRAQVGEGRVICGLSGGVDSAVAAVLIHEAIGEQLTCIFVDHGLLRLNEAARGRDALPRALQHPADPRRRRATRSSARWRASRDPETKRKTIGALFIDVFEAEAKKIGGAEFLAQGTLYPDVIESVSFTGGPSVTIKSHHNVGGLPERMNLKLVEPLRELFKDEVRALGRELGLPAAFIGRHPFPGPGLAIRCPGEVTREKLDILRQADAIYLEEIRKAGLYDQIWQAFAVLLPVRTVGVMGDARTYDHVCALRAVTSTDGMTADFFPFPHDVLGRIATRIVNEVRGINRVIYDVTVEAAGDDRVGVGGCRSDRHKLRGAYARLKGMQQAVMGFTACRGTLGRDFDLIARQVGEIIGEQPIDLEVRQLPRGSFYNNGDFCSEARGAKQTQPIGFVS